MRKYKTRFRQPDGSPLPQFVQVMIDRTGVLRTYFRHVDIRRTIGGATLRPGGVVIFSSPWWAEYFAYKNGAPLPARDDAEVEPGWVVPRSWDALLQHHTAHSPQWLTMKESTRAGYRPYHLLISKVVGQYRVAKSLSAIEPMIHKKEFGDATTNTPPAPGAARVLRTVFGMLCEDARRLGWIDHNPVRDIPKPKSRNKKGHHTWLESEVSQWRETFPDPSSDARCFLEIALAWGARASDLLGLGWQNIGADEVISFTPKKTETSTGAEVHLPVKGKHLLAVLARRSKDQRYFFQKPPLGFNQYTAGKLVDLRPSPWSYTRLRKSFAEWRTTAGLPDECAIHGLRKLFATRMANAGANPQDIGDALGDTLASAQIYTQQRDKKRGAARGVNAVSDAA